MDLLKEKEKQFFDRTEKDGDNTEGESAEYKEFVEKFKPKKGTDDCYTPDNIFEAVVKWAEKEYGIDREKIVRPFYPGGDYERYDYKEGDIVIDNPPFSLLAKIADFYTAKGIKFLLFGPGILLFNAKTTKPVCAICVGVNVVFENGASINISFLTNLEDTCARTAPDLYRAIKEENDKNLKEIKRHNPSYKYPPQVVTAAMMNRLSLYGCDFKIKKNEACYIRALDDQKEKKKSCFGGGFLISEEKAKEREAKEREAEEKKIEWKLSEREKEIIKKISKNKKENKKEIKIGERKAKVIYKVRYGF